MIEFKLPALGSDMDEGKILEWKVAPGQPVKRGDILVVVDTAKAAVDVECWDEGTLFEQLVQPGVTVPVGSVIATLLEPGEEASTAARSDGPVPTVASSKPEFPSPTLPTSLQPAFPAADERQLVSPAAQARAKTLKVELAHVEGSGPHGSITLDDVNRAASAGDALLDRTARMRQSIASAMSRSKRDIPHYYLAESIPMARATDWLMRANDSRPVASRLIMGVLQLKAVALSLKAFPQFNGFWRENAYQPAAGIHVGVAIAMRNGGLVAPALHDVDKKSLEQLMAELSDLTARARAGSLRSSELSDATVTVTNLGETGTEALFGVIYPPQVALVGFGRVEARPWIDGGQINALPVVTASLSADHRASDGHDGARLLIALRDHLQQPEQL